MTKSDATDDPKNAVPRRPSTPRKHHYIPEMIQKRFAGPDLHLFSFDKQLPERGVERKPIARLFRVPNLYTIYRQDGKRDTSTETRLSAIEGRAGSVIARAVEDARAARPSTWSATDRTALISLFMAQYRRSPDFHQRTVLRPTAEEIIAGSIAKWEAEYGRPASPEQRAFLMSPQFIAQARRNAIAANIAANAADPLSRVAAAMADRGFSVVRIAVPGCSFILGSSPFARFRAAGTGRLDLGDPEVELWFPIAHDVALVSYGTPNADRFAEFRVEAPIRQMNSMIARDSTVFASSNRALVEALSHRARRACQRKLHRRTGGAGSARDDAAQ